MKRSVAGRIGYSPQYSGAPEQKRVSAIDQRGAFKKSPSENENPRITAFFIFSPIGAGDFSFPLLKYTHRTVVQPRCISLQNFAICEIADRLQSPTARLGCSFVCTTSDFAQKKDTNPVGGRGISAFSFSFLLHTEILR